MESRLLYRRASVFRRIAATFLDVLFVGVMVVTLPAGIGSYAGLLYCLVRDCLPFTRFRGRSLGKRALGLEVRRVSSEIILGNENFGLKQSIVRNFSFFLMVLLVFTSVWGWFVFLFFGFPTLFFEMFWMIRSRKGQRFSDVMANTAVYQRIEDSE